MRTVWLAALIALAAPVAAPGAAPVAAQPGPTAASLAADAARRFPQPVAAGALLGRVVLQPLESQPVLGRVIGVVRQPGGSVAAVLRYGGWLGFGARPVAVPLEAMTLLGDTMEVVGFTPRQLDAFPTFHAAEAEPVPPDTVLHVGLSRPSH